MTKPVDLDALDAAHAALGKISPDYWQEEGGDATLAVIRTVYEDESPPRGDDEESDAPWYWARNEAGWIAAKAVEILNAYPAMSSELRERRAREEAMAAEIRALREVAEAARAFVPTCEAPNSPKCDEVATHSYCMRRGKPSFRICDGHVDEAKAIVDDEFYAPFPLDPDPRVDALRAALAKVPR